MEIKKTREADLERGRGRRLLIGLAVAVVAFVVAMEWRLPDTTDELSEADMLELLGREAELAPLSKPDEERISLAPKPQPTPETKIVVAEDDEETAEKDKPMENDAPGDLPDVADDELAAAPQEVKSMDDEPMSFRVVEDLPQFPGGLVELMKWLTRNLRYPPSARNQKIEGRVLAEFIVEKDGSLTNIRIAKSLHPLCDREALRVLHMMPKWTAGLQDAEPCRTQVRIPIVFRL